MTVHIVNRMVVAVGISAVALLGLSIPINAQPQQQQDQKRQADQKEKEQPGAKKRAAQAQMKQQQEQNQQERQAQNQQQRQQRQNRRLAVQDQQVLIAQQEQRLAQYREHLDQQQRLAQPQSAQLQQQHRNAQYSAQQQYVARLRQQQLRVQSQGRYNYGRDPYFYTPSTYRYSRGGRYYETNQYGVDLLRQAVNYGYGEGRRAGLADRQDRWDSGYEDSYAYRDANYGYSGFYVDREDYNNYFREGFRRGYEDGYSGRVRYGTYFNGRGTILGAILATILNFESIR